MMASWHPVTNIRDYIFHNPPVVTFFLCILTLAISLICLGTYSHSHTLPNPDKTKDWNNLLTSLSQLHLCTKASPTLASPVPSKMNEQPNEKNTLHGSVKTSSSVTHLLLSVPVTVRASLGTVSMTDFSLSTSLTASQLNLEGNWIVKVTLEVLSENTTHTCLNIIAPSGILPKTTRPPKCLTSEENLPTIHVEVRDQLPTASQNCYTLRSENDPALTVMLSQEERSVAVRHVFEVSVFLLGVCVLLCLSASFTHSLKRHYNRNGLDEKSEPLIDP